MSERLLYKDGMLDRICKWTAQCEILRTNAKLSDDEFKKMYQSEEIRKRAIWNLNLADLTSRLKEYRKGYVSERGCREEAEYIMKHIPDALMQNLEEWLDEKPLSNITINGISVRDVMNYDKDLKIDFIDAIKFFIEWKRFNYCDPNFLNLHFYH